MERYRVIEPDPPKKEPPKKSKRVSSLRVALIMIHLIAVPVAISLGTFVYISFKSDWNKTEICRAMCFAIMQSDKTESKYFIYLQKSHLEEIDQFPLFLKLYRKRYREKIGKSMLEYSDYNTQEDNGKGIQPNPKS